MAYINGNLAMQPKRKPEKKPVIRETRHVVVKRKSIPMQEKLLFIFTIVICVLVAGVIINRYAQIYDMSVQIKQVTNEYEAINIELKEMKKQVETLSDPSRVKDLAAKQGMTSTEQPGISIHVPDDAQSTKGE
ncbi:MAG: cell division protein FtsL [Candidatus Pristimantibacillus sp.]